MNAARPDLDDALAMQHDRLRSTTTVRLARVAALLGAAAMLIVIGGFYVFREHLTTGGADWLYVLLLACPLIHLFGYGAKPQGDGTAPRSAKPAHPHAEDAPGASTHQGRPTSLESQ